MPDGRARICNVADRHVRIVCLVFGSTGVGASGISGCTPRSFLPLSASLPSDTESLVILVTDPTSRSVPSTPFICDNSGSNLEDVFSSVSVD
ncbi:hypothetical protein E2C01_013079 [Portunus trituberculatus]|uniref:Uncharacterized protein n=1 Tax=Portunus trituberculatus TaxID=210409 RepID=A0A5B7DG53_PORTR|nr:hypothetical protein [Portunus trituberculatus]